MVGDILRREREKQGLTIADIEKGTSIRRLYIEHIERGNIAELPGLVYAKGFVRTMRNSCIWMQSRLCSSSQERMGARLCPPPLRRSRLRAGFR